MYKEIVINVTNTNTTIYYTLLNFKNLKKNAPKILVDERNHLNRT